MKDKVFYLNTARSNLFNGPHLQYFQSEGIDGQYSVEPDFGRTGRWVLLIYVTNVAANSLAQCALLFARH